MKVLLTPIEQADNLILWLGEKLRVFGAIEKIGYIPHGALIGAASPYGYDEVVAYLTREELLREGTGGTKDPSETSVSRWGHFYELQRGLRHSRTAFMAMQFNGAKMNKVYETVLKPAVERIGFKLNLLTDSPRAALIDDRLQVEIRKARFLIADLTHANLGAY